MTESRFLTFVYLTLIVGSLGFLFVRADDPTSTTFIEIAAFLMLISALFVFHHLGWKWNKYLLAILLNITAILVFDKSQVSIAPILILAPITTLVLLGRAFYVVSIIVTFSAYVFFNPDFLSQNSGFFSYVASLVVLAIHSLIFENTRDNVIKSAQDANRVMENLAESNEKLQKTLSELNQRASEIRIINEHNSLLQLCQNEDESYIIIQALLEKLFPKDKGVLYIFSEDKTHLIPVVLWNDLDLGFSVLEAPDCWCLRRSQMHYVSANSNDTLRCKHVGRKDISYICIPMIVLGETIGFLHIELSNPLNGDSVEESHNEKQQLAIATTSTIALALSNIQLRASLKDQAIIDPLTGIYNRRYMDEALALEMSRAKRNFSNIGIVLLDIDHFKSFNDKYGHEVGDKLLREVGKILRQHFREYDIPCRYGGEEFLIILPGANLESSKERAEELRSMMIALDTSKTLGINETVTISCGVASYPESAETIENIVNVADKALYQAKTNGRNQVVGLDLAAIRG